MLATYQRPPLRPEIADFATIRAELLAEKGNQVGIAAGNYLRIRNAKEMNAHEKAARAASGHEGQ